MADQVATVGWDHSLNYILSQGKLLNLHSITNRFDTWGYILPSILPSLLYIIYVPSIFWGYFLKHKLLYIRISLSLLLRQKLFDVHIFTDAGWEDYFFGIIRSYVMFISKSFMITNNFLLNSNGRSLVTSGMQHRINRWWGLGDIVDIGWTTPCLIESLLSSQAIYSEDRQVFRREAS